jgi:hypothetical protein
MGIPPLLFYGTEGAIKLPAVFIAPQVFFIKVALYWFDFGINNLFCGLSGLLWLSER